MENIILTRIDERLVHGQVQMWIKSLGCNLVLVANDEVSEDKISQTLMKTSIPNSIEMRFFSIKKTCDIIHKASPKQKIYLVVKSCTDANRLVQGGVDIKKINLGNVHKKEGSEKISRSIYLLEEDKKALKEMLEKGIDFDTQSTPIGNSGSSEVNIREVIGG